MSLPEEVTIHATIEDKDATKTVMDESNNILWSENDQIIAFMKSSYGHKYQVKPSFVGKSYADFSMVSSGNSNDLSAGNEWEHNVVYYPHSENIECLKSGANYALEVNLPAEQTYVPDSFANGSMAMVAVSENNNITFKNVLGGIKLQLKGTQKITSITIEGKNNEKLSGDAVVTAYTDGSKPVITMTSDASTSVTLTCCESVQLNENTVTEFVVTLPPILFSKGLTVNIKSLQGDIYTVDTDKTNTVLRSSILIMPEVTLNAVVSQSNHYIDEYGINHGEGIEIDGVVWAPVNCGYKAASSTSNGFTRGKLYQWGRKYGQGFTDDEIAPAIEHGPVMLSVGQSKENENIRYAYDDDNTEYPHNDWLITQNNNLWNSGTETEPIKSQYDPCPDGWRVPTHSELKTLVTHYTKDTEGWIFYGAYDARENVNTLFLPFTGDGWWGGSASKSSSYGYYWSSSPSTYTYKGASYSELVEFSNFSGDLIIDKAINYKYRSNAYSVRCVQE